MKPKSKAEYLYLLKTENMDGLNYAKAKAKTKRWYKRYLSKARRKTDKHKLQIEQKEAE